ncbi:MTH1187 family thiamine-binding protein [Halomonas koreensis]|uniref:MTH1187 family thiamine-binding protein n=1 Tax=Halomonas koreensis TaxID=245385 RepID=A0ABU1G222_9GAMM|nr:MTH1187 family thiamine-binding protein [Halomonas koreensis]MDR5866981.1 MTH1187 family thiamine-binding protein [Halomonas koreensis]
MNVIVDLCVVPMGVGVSVSPQVAACQRVIEASGLSHRMHAYGTNLEGPWDEVMAVVKRCHEVVHEMGAPRITSTLKLGTRVDRDQSMDDKVASVERLLDPGREPEV